MKMNTTAASKLLANVTTPQVQGDPSSSNDTVEAYTVVLSMAAHLTSMIFGGGSTIAVLAAITTKSNINKFSYLLVLILFFACFCINFVWSPLEVTDLLMHHFHQRHPSDQFVAAKTSIYLLFIVLIHVVTLLLAVEGVMRITSCFGSILQRVWPFTASLFAIGWSVVLAAVLVIKLADYPDPAKHSYVFTEENTRYTFLTILVFIFTLSLLALLLLIILFLKLHIHCKNGWPHFRQKKLNLALPEFLISQSQNAGEDEIGGYDNVNEPSTSRSPSPSTPKLLTVSSPDSGSIQDDGGPPQPNAMPKTSGNRLGINMSQVLGRRRHTICQISESSNSPAVQSDPITKAKQYNYVRKFSVDISALQAQLQNPKIFKEAPFQSDVDLAKKAEDSKSRVPKPLQPLQPLNLKLKNDGSTKTIDKKVDSPQSAGLSVPPPVIMVSDDDALPEHDSDDDEKDKEEKKPADIVVFDFDKDRLNHHHTKPEKPTTLPLKESSHIDEVTSVPTLESALTEPSDTELEGNKLARLAVYVSLTFLLSILPVLITEALRPSMSRHAFVNISTCTLAISAIQTILFPHLVASSDDVVHRAVRRLNNRVKTIFCPGELAHSSHGVDDTSSTSQV